MTQNDEAFAPGQREPALIPANPLPKARYSQPEAELRARAAEYAAALLVERPELCRDELDSFVQALDQIAKVPEWTSDIVHLVTAFENTLERDDEDTDETARLIFEALAK